MNDFLPSRKVTAFLLVPIVTIFLLWAVLEYYKTPQVVEQKESELAKAIAAGNLEFQDQDTDGDGLKDWEEFLYQTDEQNKDTDGDGSSDGAEVKKGHDPLVAGTGSDDTVAPQNESGFSFYKNDTNLTATDVLARDIFSAYTDLKKNDSFELEKLRDAAVKKVIQENTSFKSEELLLTIDEITTRDSSLTSKRAYKREYVQVTKALASVSFNDLELLARYFEFGDDSALVQMNKNQVAYESFYNELKKISPPDDIAAVHLEIINNLNVFIDTLEKMQLFDVDPLTALVKAEQYINDDESLKKSFATLSLYFQQY